MEVLLSSFGNEWPGPCVCVPFWILRNYNLVLAQAVFLRSCGEMERCVSLESEKLSEVK